MDRIWTSRLKPYVSSPLDPETGDPYFPPSAPYRCPDWNLSRLTAGADANDCDGPGTIEGLTSFVLGRHMRSELFSTYGLVFGMCSFQEAQSGLATCMRNGGYTPDYTSYGRGGTSANDAMFTFAGDELYPPSTGLYLGRTLAQIARPSETVMLGDGGTWKRVPGYYTTVFGCEGDHMHWQHVWGGNVAFADGHANWIGGNPEGITQVGTDGFWIEKYFTFYE